MWSTAKRGGEGNEALLPEVEDVVGVGLAEVDFLILQGGVLVELREPLVQPDRDPGVGFAQHVVGVLVVDDGEGVVAFGVEAEKDVVAIGDAKEEAGEIELVFAEVDGGLDGAGNSFLSLRASTTMGGAGVRR